MNQLSQQGRTFLEISECDQLRLLLDVNNAMVSTLELMQLLAVIASSLRRVIRHEYTSLALYDHDRKRCAWMRSNSQPVRDRFVIERAVILTQGQTLQVPLAELKRPTEVVSDSVIPLDVTERRLILHALNEAKWVIGGPTGAAARLGMKRTTLQGKMRKLGISRPS